MLQPSKFDLIFKELEKEAAVQGIHLQRFGDSHFRLRGKRTVDYWPISKWRTAWVWGAASGVKQVTVRQAVRMACRTGDGSW